VNEIDQIRQQMAQIRRELHEDVSSVVNGVEEVVGWTSLLRKYPLTSVGVALALGYLIVHRRADRAGVGQAAVSESQALANGLAKPRPRIAGRMLQLLWPIAEQAIQAYAAMWIQRQIEHHLHPGLSRGTPSMSQQSQNELDRDEFVFSRPK
jgi:hypothetical protein